MTNKFVVYTALFGDYDNLIDPKEKYEGCDFICFSDQKHLKSDIWDIRITEECDLPSNMMNRRYKILPHLFLNEYEQSLYVDANIFIRNNPTNLANKYLVQSNIAISKHYGRNCIYSEAIEIIKAKKAKKEDVEKQVNLYKEEGFPEKFGLTENGIIFRNHNSRKIIFLMEAWWKELTNQTKRDQLSLMYLVWKNDVSIETIEENARGNKYFKLKLHKNEYIDNCHLYNYLIEFIHNYPFFNKFFIVPVLIRYLCYKALRSK